MDGWHKVLWLQCPDQKPHPEHTYYWDRPYPLHCHGTMG